MQRKDLASILFAITAFPLDYPVYTLLPEFSTVLIIIITVVLLSTASYLALSDRRKKNFKIDIVGPHKGYMLPPKFDVKDIGDGMKEARYTNNNAEPSDYAKVELSEKLETYEINGDTGLAVRDLVVKFGVLRITCLADEALGCRVSIRVKLMEQLGKSYPFDYSREQGYLNWYSQAIKRDIQSKFTSKLIIRPTSGLNEYLKNTTEDLDHNDPRDLLLFYMINADDIPNVFLCTDIQAHHAGILDIERKYPVRFEASLKIKAQGLRSQTERFSIVVKDFDNYQIQKLK